jgi:hypothetical protein
VEKEVPGAKAATCLVAAVLILHHVDMLASAYIKDDVMGTADLVTLLLWVVVGPGRCTISQMLWSDGHINHRHFGVRWLYQLE